MYSNSTIEDPTNQLESLLEIDLENELEFVSAKIKQITGKVLRKRGLVLGVSGGVDSAVCAALAVHSLGCKNVRALLMPEFDFDDSGSQRAVELCEQLGIDYTVEDIGPALQAMGCYSRRDEAIKSVFPEYGDDYRQKIVVAGDPLGDARLNYFNLVIETPDGELKTARLPVRAYQQIVAATNMKQRTRKQMEYYHAEKFNFGVIGTPNRLEYELGFFVRGGDGLADLKPIAHLYKSQVYALAKRLDVPESIVIQPPSTDTYSLPQTQEEFYFALPFEKMDRALLASNQNWDIEKSAVALKVSNDQMRRVFRDMDAKRRVAHENLRDAVLIRPLTPTKG